MSSRFHRRGTVVFCIAAIAILLACSLPSGSANNGVPAFDPTKVSLELQATAMSLQLTQAAADNQTAPSPLPPAPTLTPPPLPTATLPAAVPVEVQPTSTQDWTARMKDANILVYENTDERNIGLWIREALDNLRLKYTWTGSYSGHFMEFLNSGTVYDLIIVGAEDKDKISGEFWDVINTRLIRDKAALIAEVWYLDFESNGPINKIMGRCGIAYRKNYDLADSIYWWDPTHPIFNEPNTVLPLLHYDRYWANQTGDQIRLNGKGDAVMLAGLAAQPGQEGVLATCEGGRVVFQTFSDHDYHEEDVVPLWENYIYWTLKNRFAVSP